jgi:predicted lactoylglutathione lyase
MNTNRDLKGNNQNITVAQIKEAAEYYRTRTLEINKQLSKLNKENYLLNEKTELIRLQLTELNFNENQRSNQVIILIDAEQASTSECTLSYLVSDCGWVATYDLSAEDLNQKN